MRFRPPTLIFALAASLQLACATGKSGSPVAATDDSATRPAEALFAKYVARSNSFDPKLAELYADDAIIRSSRRLADGSVKKLEMQGLQWKQLVARSAALAKERGDVSEFSKVRYRPIDGGFEVRTHRRSALKCHVDDQHRLVMKTDARGDLKIFEEDTQTASLSSCPDQDPTPLMQQQVDSLASRLPLQVDEDTRLESLRIKGKTLVYTYTLVTTAPGELDVAKTEELMRGVLVAQSCLDPKLRALLDNGADVTYVYNTKGGEPFLQLSLDERDCP